MLCLDDDDTVPIGYMDPTHEDEYLAQLDASLGSQPIDGLTLPVPTSSAPKLSDKELSIRNPSSVYNWLRRHQPHVFSAPSANGGGGREGDEASEKSGLKPPKARSKKKKGATTIQAEDANAAVRDRNRNRDRCRRRRWAFAGDMYQGGSARGKKRAEDQSFQPKGESSARKSRKRKGPEGLERKRKKRKVDPE